MVPLAWRCLIRQAERPDQVAFTIVYVPVPVEDRAHLRAAALRLLRLLHEERQALVVLPADGVAEPRPACEVTAERKVHRIERSRDTAAASHALRVYTLS